MDNDVVMCWSESRRSAKVEREHEILGTIILNLVEPKPEDPYTLPFNLDAQTLNCP